MRSTVTSVTGTARMSKDMFLKTGKSLHCFQWSIALLEELDRGSASYSESSVSIVFIFFWDCVLFCVKVWACAATSRKARSWSLSVGGSCACSLEFAATVSCSSTSTSNFVALERMTSYDLFLFPNLYNEHFSFCDLCSRAVKKKLITLSRNVAALYFHANTNS